MWKPSWAREVPQPETKAEGDQLEDIVIMMGPAVPVLIVDNVYLYDTVPLGDFFVGCWFFVIGYCHWSLLLAVGC